ARAALKAERLAGAISEARRLADANVALVSDWLRPDVQERDEIASLASAGLTHGYVQTYEDANGAPVFAVSFWKPLVEDAKTPETASSDMEDHTDDTYFTKPHLKRGKAKRKPRKRRVDPNQLDLFHGPDQQGYERRDPNNPGVVLVDEEGDGATFGRATRGPKPRG
ncbi:MAG: hypothetical protein AAF719_13090, partial [Pseudomonadota bacterium]